MPDTSKLWQQCGAKTRSGAPCKSPACSGSARCRMHGGTIHRRANARKAAVQKMAKVVAAYGLPLEGVEPSEALQMEIERTVGIVEFLAEKLRNAGAGDLVERITVETSMGDSQYVMKRTESAVGPWLELFLAERRHLGQITTKAIALGLEEQRLELDRRSAVAVEAAVLYLIHAHGLSEREPDVRATVNASIVEAQRAYRAATMSAALPMRR